jgi:hypothetical protein
LWKPTSYEPDTRLNKKTDPAQPTQKLPETALEEEDLASDISSTFKALLSQLSWPRA